MSDFEKSIYRFLEMESWTNQRQGKIFVNRKCWKKISHFLQDYTFIMFFLKFRIEHWIPQEETKLIKKKKNKIVFFAARIQQDVKCKNCCLKYHQKNVIGAWLLYLGIEKENSFFVYSSEQTGRKIQCRKVRQVISA